MIRSGFFQRSLALGQWIWPFPQFCLGVGVFCSQTWFSNYIDCARSLGSWVPCRHLKRHLIVSARSHKICILFDRSELKHASRQHCCWTVMSPAEAPVKLETISRLCDLMRSKIYSSRQRNVLSGVYRCVAMRVGLPNETSTNGIDAQSRQQTNVTTEAKWW